MKSDLHHIIMIRLIKHYRTSALNFAMFKTHKNSIWNTRDVFYVRREVDLMKTAKLNAYIMHIFGKIELLSIYATQNYFKMHYFNVI